MAEKRKHDAAGNQGIQANAVTADVLAVGRNATAHKQVTMGATPQELLQAVAQLRSALEGLALPGPAKQVLADDIKALTAATSAAKPNSANIQLHLKSLSDKLKMVGLVMKDVTQLWEPAENIAKLAMIPLHLVGL
jgi:hypothetical protein